MGETIKLEHTPTPWHAGYGYIWGPQMEMIGDVDDEEAYVLRMRGVGADLPIEANQAFIVEAVNVYDSLRSRVTALEVENTRLRNELVRIRQGRGQG